MSKTKTVKLIDSTYRKLHHALDPFSHANYAERIFELEREAERGHRQFAPASYRPGISIPCAARLFTCKHLLEYYLDPQETIDAVSVLDLRLAVLLAAGVAARYREAIANAITEDEARAFLDAVDYVELVRS